MRPSQGQARNTKRESVATARSGVQGHTDERTPTSVLLCCRPAKSVEIHSDGASDASYSKAL